MKFLVDNARPPRLARILDKEHGHSAVHLRSYGIQDAPDEVVLERALTEDRVLLSADTDFGALLASRNLAKPSFVLFRKTDLVQAEEYAQLLIKVLPLVERDLQEGAVVVIRDTKVRIRRLPLASNL